MAPWTWRRRLEAAPLGAPLALCVWWLSVAVLAAGRESRPRIFVAPPLQVVNPELLAECYTEMYGVDPLADVPQNGRHAQAGHPPQHLNELLLYRQIVASGLQVADPADATLVFFNPMTILSATLGCHCTGANRTDLLERMSESACVHDGPARDKKSRDRFSRKGELRRAHQARQAAVVKWMAGHEHELPAGAQYVTSCPAYTCRVLNTRATNSLIRAYSMHYLTMERNEWWFFPEAFETKWFSNATEQLAMSTGEVETGIMLAKTGYDFMAKQCTVPYVAHSDLARNPRADTVRDKPTAYFAGHLKKLARLAGLHALVRTDLGRRTRSLSDVLEITARKPVNSANPAAPYAEQMAAHAFCVVPVGDTPTSRRLFDAMVAGCVPIIIADNLHPSRRPGSLPFARHIPYVPTPPRPPSPPRTNTHTHSPSPDRALPPCSVAVWSVTATSCPTTVQHLSPPCDPASLNTIVAHGLGRSPLIHPRLQSTAANTRLFSRWFARAPRYAHFAFWIPEDVWTDEKKGRCPPVARSAPTHAGGWVGGWVGGGLGGARRGG